MKIAHEWHINAHAVELLTNRRNGGSSISVVDSDPNHFGTGSRQVLDLNRSADHIGSVRVRH